MCNCGRCQNSNGEHERNNEICLNSIYAEIINDLNLDMKISSIRDFSFIYAKDVGLSIFISNGVLYIVKGNKLPPVIYKESINNPDFDIAESIYKICNENKNNL